MSATPDQPHCYLRIAVPSPLRRSFDYLPPAAAPPLDSLQPGIRVRVPFGRRELVGILLAVVPETDVEPDRLRQASEILDQQPLLPPHLLALCQWAANYYHHPIGEVLHSLLPVDLRRGKKAEIRRHHSDKASVATTAGTALQLNPAQAAAVAAINQASAQFRCFLLDGVTGSGKTEVYLQAIAEVLARGAQALVLIPEISLTPQTLERFRQRFGTTMAVLHSGLSDRQRLNAWLRAASGEAAIIIGTRSAVFTPMQHPGIIIVDEEHDSAFKQQDGFRYSARDLAVLRARQEDIPIVLGSATPSLESLHNARQGRYTVLQLPQRAGDASTPAMHLLDINNQPLQEGFAPALIDSIRQHLQQGGQVLVFINRRGFAPVLQCQDCNWVAECQHCDARLTLHRRPPQLRCHHCDRRQAVIRHCPQCQSRNLDAIGIGTERSEHWLQQQFPAHPVIRIDRDTTRNRDAMQAHLEQIHSQPGCILVGTQMLAKGHHFPAVTLVAVLDADCGLFSADFRGQEHMAQLLIQVAGRAGRADRPGEVMVQTRHAGHAALHTLASEGYATFADLLLEERRKTGMPPFGHLALLRADAVSLAAPMQFLEQVASELKHRLAAGSSPVQLSGPVPAPMEKRASRFRAQLLLRASERSSLQQALGQLTQLLESLPGNRRVRWSLDVDPQDML